MDIDVFRPSAHVSPIARVIYDKLGEEQKKRKIKALETWMKDEVAFLWEETCRQRALLGKGPIPFAKVESAERMAQGHVDYTHKCALYCQELVKAD